MTTKYGDRGEPRWLDVADYLNEVGRAHGGYLRIRMGSEVPARVGKYLQISVEFWPKGRSLDQGFTAQEHLYWPHDDHRSMTSALVKLALQLDFKLTQRQLAAEAQARF